MVKAWHYHEFSYWSSFRSLFIIEVVQGYEAPHTYTYIMYHIQIKIIILREATDLGC